MYDASQVKDLKLWQGNHNMEMMKLFTTRFSRLYKRAVVITLVLLLYIMIQIWPNTEQSSVMENSQSQTGIRQRTTQMVPSTTTNNYTQPVTKSIIWNRIDNHTRAAYVFMPYYGRFGNNLFQYASAYSIARDTYRTVVIQGAASDAFKAMLRGIAAPVHWLERPIETLMEGAAGKYQADLTRQSDRDVNLCCFLQSWRYFQKYAADIRKEFTVRDDLIAAARKLRQQALDRHITTITRSGDTFRPITAQDVTVVGVHVRRQDFTLQQMNKRGYVAAPKSYFHKAMQYFRHRHNNTLFIVCSDDPAWPVHNLLVNTTGGQLHDVQIISESTDADFPLLISCDHVIMSVGSYGWWAGWLSGGTVVYYSGWPKPGTVIGDQYKQQDYFLPNWIAIARWSSLI